MSSPRLTINNYFILLKHLCYQQQRNLSFSTYSNRLVERRVAPYSPLVCSFASSVRRENSNSSRFSVAIVGSGPGGFYTAKYLKSEVERLNNNRISTPKEGQKQQYVHLHIDIIEKLPTPFGLVRFGVAPDHQETKNVENDFSSIITKSSAAAETSSTTTSINYVGNVTVGVHVSLQELLGLYDAVVLAYGCNSDQKLVLDKNGNHDMLMGIYSAREFVAWYNGHPDFGHIGERVAKMISSPAGNASGKAHVVIIGNGNVALDCARILAKGTNGLLHTDMASRALPVLQDGVKQITIIGRRGHVQASFTIKVPALLGYTC
jgi:adrenodoxin-NADP+ reductase